jgi:hypothetical protein
MLQRNQRRYHVKTVNGDMTLSAEYKIKVRGKLKWRPALFSLPSLENE